METILADLRHSLRLLLKSPGFSIVALAALALGIGANTAIFSVVNAVLLRPLPYPDSERLVFVRRQFPQGGTISISIPKFMVWKQHDKTLEHMSAYDFTGPGLNLAGGDRPEQVKGIHVSMDYFKLFGASPMAGRTFLPEEDRPGGPNVIVMSHGLWKRRFGGDPGLVGRSIQLSGQSFTVAGILAPGFQSDPPADIWMPLQADPASTNQGHYLRVGARLRPGATLEQAAAEMKLAANHFRRLHPQAISDNETVAPISMQEQVVGDVRPALVLLAGAVCFVLLIACANVANLLLARASARQKDIAIRAALGATRRRLLRLLLTESVALAGLGAVLGLLLGAWGVRILLALSPGNIPLLPDLRTAPAFALLDGRVLAFTAGVALLTGILFGLFPALQLSRPDLNSTLKESGARSGTGVRHAQLRALLVTGEVALALVLLVGAGLLIRTFVGLRSVPLGFDANNVLAMEMSISGPRYSTTAQVAGFERQAIQRIEALPGVVAVASAVSLPLEGGPDLPFTIEGKPPADPPYNGDEQYRSVGYRYFDTLRIPLLRGRLFAETDTGNSAPVVIINQAMAGKFWPNEDPIGQRITIGKGLGPQFEDATRQIVGVVGDVHENSLGNPQPVMYIPAAQVPDGLTRFVQNIIASRWIVRTGGDPAGFASLIEREFLAIDGLLPVGNIRPLQQVVRNASARENFNMTLLGVFAGIALLLAAIGVYGLMAYSVQQRSHEIGIRMALGADRGTVLRLFVFQGMRLALAGVVVGLAGAFGLTRFLAGLLYGVRPTDPLTFIAVAAALLLIALVATLVPARRATRIDPIVTLRYE